MKPDARFVDLPLSFWAHVRSLSEICGYTKKGEVLVPTLQDLLDAMSTLRLATDHLATNPGEPTALATLLLNYFGHRANVLNIFVKQHLMTAAEAKSAFESVRATATIQCPLPMNKQKGEKRAYAYLTGIINTLIAENTTGYACNFDPRTLTSVTHEGKPVRTLSRRVDGAFPSAINPIAIWEVKEYYYTTSFGSRIADGVFETQLDGLELSELHASGESNYRVLHFLMIDAYETWWDMGKSYLCRIIDMLHMGLVDEVFFGKEILDRLPVVARELLDIAKDRGLTTTDIAAVQVLDDIAADTIATHTTEDNANPEK